MRVLAVLFALVAIICLATAIAGMATGKMDARRGTTIRVVALVSFAIAVVLNIPGATTNLTEKNGATTLQTRTVIARPNALSLVILTPQN